MSRSDVPPNPGLVHPLPKREVRHAARSRRAAIAAGLTPAQRERAATRLADAVITLVGELGDLRDLGDPGSPGDPSDPSDPGDPGSPGSPGDPGPSRLRVAAYESLPDEPPTGPLIVALLAGGHEVVVPVTLPDWSLQWRRAEPGAVGDASTVARRPLPPSPSSPPSPVAEVTDVSMVAGPGEREAGEHGWLGQDALMRVDLVITPGLSVDRQGTRLGQGGGCYDRALSLCNPTALVLTLLHEGELSETALPCDEHDVPVDGVVTTAGTVIRVPWPPTSPEPE